jgi:undecaprenyl-diphosphatase
MSIDQEITIFLNGFVGKSHPLGAIIAQLLTATSFGNAMLPMAIITGLWFSRGYQTTRDRMILGACASLGMTALSRSLELLVRIQPRPYLAMDLNLAPGFQLDVSRLSSFPSDHATLVFGLCAVIFLRHKGLGIASFAWMMVICAAGVALGLHWPSDIVAGLVLGVVAVVLSQRLRYPEWAWKWVWDFEELHSGPFYGLMLLGAYETATFFGDIQTLCRLL